MEGTPGEPRPQNDCLICLDLADDAVVSKCCVMSIMCLACYEKVKDLPTGCPNCRRKKPDFVFESNEAIRKFNVDVSPEIQLTVNMINGQKIVLKMRNLEKTPALISQVSERSGIAVDQLRLISGTKTMLETKSLRSWNLANGSVMQLQRMLGG